MKITCQACQAKYTIADEKVAGKVVKIRCKKCGATIVVGGDGSATTSQPPAMGGAVDFAKGGAGGWTVNVKDGDQRTMSEAELVQAYRSNVVGDDTFCWKEGMADWLPFGEITELRAAAVGGAALEGAVAVSEDDAPARNGKAEQSPASSAGAGGAALKDGNGALPVVAARRAGGRAPDNDLFGSAAKAGGEDDVMTSAPAGEKLTGARNESSVLFALNPTPEKPAGPPSGLGGPGEASGLIDIRQLSEKTRSPASDAPKKNTRVDDIMNLGGAATFNPNLAAPVLAAPSLEHISTPPPPSMLGALGPGSPAKKAMIFLIFAAASFFLVAAIAVVMFLFRGHEAPVAQEHETPSASAESDKTAASAGASAKSAPSANAAAASASSAASAAPTETASAPAPVKEATKEPAPREPATPHAAAPPRESPPVGAPAAEFNMGEARARLGAIAGGVQSCKRGETTGTGKVEITFAPSGAVQSASLMPGSPFDGSLTAKCVEARFRGARIPGFGGGPMTVSKSFNIN